MWLYFNGPPFYKKSWTHRAISLNVYGDQVIIFLPNLLIADNDLKLVAVYKNLKNDDKATEVRTEGKLYLAESLKDVKTEWAFQIKKGLED